MADAEPDSSASAIDRAITSVLASLDGISELKCEQEKALKAFLSGEDVLALLPTGFGKSLIYQLVPLVCKAYLQTEGERSSLFPGVENPIVIVVSPLVALMEDQVKEAAKLGITAAQLGGTSDQRILSGSVQLVFGSPESWILNDKWRTMLASARYRRNLVGIVVDEVHMMHKWGQGKKGKPAFREAFSRLGELRSLVKEGTPILALTASADIPSRERVISLLNMQGAQRIHVSPNKENIRLGLMKVPRDDLRCLDWVVKSIRDNGESAPQTIIYCKSIKAIGMVYHYLQAELAEDAWVDKDPERKTKNHLIGIFHGNTLPKHKQNVLSALSEDGNCRVIAATTALGMGMNFPKVSSVILYGPPADTEGVLQQFGRAGRDGSAVNAILYYHGTQLIKVDASVKSLVATKPDECIRKRLYGQFEENTTSVKPGHLCCTHCHRTCDCTDGSCNVPFPHSEAFQNIVKLPTRFRDVDSDDRDLLRELLHEYQSCLLQHSTNLFTSPGACTGFSDELIEAVVSNCTHIFDIEFISTHLPVFRAEHAKEILRIIYEVFGDIERPEPSALEDISHVNVPNIDYPGYFDEPDIFDDWDDDCLLYMYDSADSEG